MFLSKASISELEQSATVGHAKYFSIFLGFSKHAGDVFPCSIEEINGYLAMISYATVLCVHAELLDGPSKLMTMNLLLLI